MSSVKCFQLLSLTRWRASKHVALATRTFHCTHIHAVHTHTHTHTHKHTHINTHTHTHTHRHQRAAQHTDGGPVRRGRGHDWGSHVRVLRAHKHLPTPHTNTPST